MEMPKKLVSMYGGKVCEFCPFGNMRQIVEYGYTIKDKKKYPKETQCTAGYVRNEQDTVYIDTGNNNKQTFVTRPQKCIDENGV